MKWRVPITQDGPAGEILLSLCEAVAIAAQPSEIECEVIRLFDLFRDSLLRYTLSFGVPINDAEELVQEVFLALFRHLKAGKSRQNLPGWLFRVAHNLALKQRRNNQRTQEKLNVEGGFHASEIDPLPNPESLAAESERQQHLLAVFRALPEQDQCCLSLRAEGLRYRDIARALGISLGTVSTSLARSIARLVRATET